MRKLTVIKIIVLVACLALFALFFRHTDQLAETDETKHQFVVHAGQIPVKLKVPRKDNFLIFTVKSFDCGGTIAGGTDPYSVHELPQGQFCMVTVSVKNGSKQHHKFDAVGQYLVSVTKPKPGEKPAPKKPPIKYVPDILATKLTNDIWKDLAPGESEDGVILFDIPKTIVITSIELRDTPESGGIRVDIPQPKPNSQN